ncbi:MAG: PAS domain-containing sensor histidine kinase, partial [Bacteroidetes bacterium]|nr:PAS domain-containing sensor histidine kinase [Bacteroidota bacterium]
NKLCEKNINEINALPPEEVAKEREKAITEKRNYFIFTHRLFSGEERTVEVHSSPIIYDNNKLLFSIIYDITERTIAEKDLMRQDEELRKLNDDKNRFISILGHDLKGPLYSIRGLLEIIAPNIRDYSIDETESFINMIYSSVQNTTVLLEDILMWAMSNSGRIPFEPQLINIGKVCENIIENIQQVAKEKDISISYTSNMDIIVLADLDAEINPINLKIIVSDNGVGIRPEIMNKLFDLSQKITSIGTANEKGTGLGLLLCKEFVKMHGGEIWVESEVGKGSNFIFTLPLIK